MNVKVCIMYWVRGSGTTHSGIFVLALQLNDEVNIHLADNATKH